MVITAPLPSPPAPAFREARADHVEAGRVRCPGGIGDRHADGIPQPGAGGAHGGRAEHDVPVAAGQLPVQRPTAARGPGPGSSRPSRTCWPLMLTSTNAPSVIWLMARVPAQAVQQRPGDCRLGPRQPVTGEIGLERCAVQLGRGHQVGQAGAEDGRRAQRGHRHHRAEQRRAHRLPVPAPLSSARRIPTHSGGRQASPARGPARRHRQRRLPRPRRWAAGRA